MPRPKEFDYDEKLAVARELFWRKGYHATSLHDLVDTLQLNRSSIYNTYGNKHDLFLKCLHSYIQQNLAEYKQAGTRGSSPLQAVENMIRSAVGITLEDKKVCLIVKTSFELGKLDEQVQQVLRLQNQTLVRLFADLLAQAQAAGEIPATKSPELIAYFIVFSFSGLWQSDIVYQDSELVGKLTEHLIQSLRN